MAPGLANKSNNSLPLWGNEKTMNLNNLILTNIQSSHYFKVNLFDLKTYHEVIDEIYYKVTHMEPWEKGSRKTSGQTGMCGGVRGVGAGGIVSTAFCLLYKLFTLKLTRKQLVGLITHVDSPYIRALGFMYIRYTQPPQDLWDWFEEYLDDDEELDVKAGSGGVTTIGDMLRHYLTKLEWYSTLFPRIPVPIQKDIEKKLSSRLPLPKPVAALETPGTASSSSAGGKTSGQSGNATGSSNAEHIPDDEVSWGEAERISRLRRSASRERKQKKDDKQCENGRRSDDKDGGGGKGDEKDRNRRQDRRTKDDKRRGERSDRGGRNDRSHRSSRDIADDIAREKDRQKVLHPSRSRSRDRDRRHRSRSRDRVQVSRNRDRNNTTATFSRGSDRRHQPQHQSSGFHSSRDRR